ncbi:MAG: hypothetical protein R3B45_11710 [Bdellovibrionota bacterium]
MKILAIIILIYECFLGCNSLRYNSIEKSKLHSETDDTPNASTDKLIDVSAKIEAFINENLAKLRTDVFAKSKWSDDDKKKFLGLVYEEIASNVSGSGIKVLGKEVSLKTRIETWLEKNLDEKRNEILWISFIDSKYGKNDIEFGTGKVPTYWTKSGAEHSIAPVINVGGTLMGIDKIGHFFMQGFWYWDAQLTSLRNRCEFGQYMEGNSMLFKEKWSKYYDIVAKWLPPTILGHFRFGYYGSWATGVVSYADSEANEAGYQFYKYLFANAQTYQFKFSDFGHHLPMMSEFNNPNKYTHDIVVDEVVAKSELKDSCWQFDKIRQTK